MVEPDAFTLLAERPETGKGALRVLQTVPSALAALRANKGRSILTTLGIIIGVAAGAGTSVTLKAADADAITQNVQGLTGVSPVVSGNAQIVDGNQNWSTRVQAVDPAYLLINDWKIGQGSAFSPTRTTPPRATLPFWGRRS